MMICDYVMTCILLLLLMIQPNCLQYTRSVKTLQESLAEIAEFDREIQNT
ncbi:MAG: hypothetical protein ACI90V_010432, partial [Bacillariaceae sp.]|jgi:hypothetical protein